MIKMQWWGIEAPGKNRDYLVKSLNKVGILQCCEMMNQLEPGELGIPKFIVIPIGEKFDLLEDSPKNEVI